MLRAGKRIAPLVFIVLVSLPAFGVDRYHEWLARISSFEGSVQSQKASVHRWQAVSVDETYFKGDSIRTLDRSRARLQLPNETYWDLNQNSRVNLTDSSVGNSSALSVLLELWEGAALFRSRQSKSINFRTPRLSGANQGTEFLVEASDEATIVTVYDGVVDAWNEHGKLSVAKGQSAIARKGHAPEPYIRVRPQDAAQWALYYPPVIDLRGAAREGQVSPDIGQALSLYRHGDLTGALLALDQVDEGHRTTLFHNLRAGILLTAGQVGEAERDIRQALKLKPEDATAVSQLAVVAVAKNEKEVALSLARQSERNSPRSVPAKLALSYALQSLFDLEQALDAAQQAVDIEPTNSLGLARLAELELSLGQNRRGEATVRRLIAIDPEFGRAKALLGFAQLLQMDTDDALQSFGEAVARNPSDPLSWFGRGLARIRKGDVAEGTRELEHAASLSPDDSLIRSYLGKAYYEQKRSEPAEAEYGRAKELDPKDPTPHFYGAIKLQSENRPVEALHEMQQAIELNDNRTVYRSRQMLDADLAARSAAQGRIYNNVGFQQRALLEGWKSVTETSSDYSAHRLLADSYGKLRKYELAKSSELFQSQMLQPMNMTPLQPQLAELGLFIPENAGPAESSFNEFNPMFSRNRFALQTSGVYGSFHTVGDEVVHAGIVDKLSYSLGQFHYESDGFRPNNDVRHDIYTGFAQYQLTPELSIQTELRHRETVTGDLKQNFEGTFSTTERNAVRRDIVRGGFHFKPASNQDLLFSYSYQDRTRNIAQEGFDFDLGTNTERLIGIKTEFSAVEARYIYQGTYWSMDFGGGMYSQRKRTSDIEPTPLPDFPFSRQSYVNTTQDDGFAYLYNTFRIHEKARLIAGLTYDGIATRERGSYRDAIGSDTEYCDSTKQLKAPCAPVKSRRSELSPKFGLIWNVTPTTTIRAAWFKYLKRPFAAEQVMEPVNVAGFNQLFDDLDLSRVTRFGVGIDHRFGKDLIGGLELSSRTLRIPGSETGRQTQDLHRAYLYWTPAENLAVSADYFHESQQDPIHAGLDKYAKSRLWTNYLPLAVSYFDPSGIYGKLSATYVNQTVRYRRDVREYGDDFWVVDASIGYRLPKRYGTITLGIKNLLDEKFQYEDGNLQDSDPRNPLFVPRRYLYLQFTLAL